MREVLKEYYLKIYGFFGLLVLGLLGILSFSRLVFGQDAGQTALNALGWAGQNQLNNLYPSVQFNANEFLLLIIAVRNLILFIGIVAGVIFIVLGGISYMRSGGDEAKVATARSQIIGGIIGLAVAVAVFLILNFIVDFVRQRTGINVLTGRGP